MPNLRRRIPWQTESLFAENHEAFFNSIDPSRPFAARLCGDAARVRQALRFAVSGFAPLEMLIEIQCVAVVA